MKRAWVWSMSNPVLHKLGKKMIYERFVRDLEKLPIKDAVFHNYDRTITPVVQADKVQKLILKYAKKSMEAGK